jgi:hypothetical protein
MVLPLTLYLLDLWPDPPLGRPRLSAGNKPRIMRMIKAHRSCGITMGGSKDTKGLRALLHTFFGARTGIL